MNNKCPKCGFYLISSNCPKCGYDSEHIYIKKYKYETNDLELLIKDDYLKIINNENIYIIIVLGPLYFLYYKFYFTSFILTSIELFINVTIASYLSQVDTISSIALMPLFIAFMALERFFYSAIYNIMLLSLLKKRLTKLKKKNNYKELIYKYKPKSIFGVISFVLLIILTIIIYLLGLYI